MQHCATDSSIYVLQNCLHNEIGKSVHNRFFKQSAQAVAIEIDFWRESLIADPGVHLAARETGIPDK
jgi:hypothetical protein